MKIKKRIVLAILFLGAAIVTMWYAVRYPQFFFKKEDSMTIMVGFPDRGVRVSVEVARDPYAWSKGLMYRKTLANNTGMLFVFPNEAMRSFWMKNTLIPLDMIFISRENKVVTVRKNATPCTTVICPQYTSTADAMYVLEVNAGFADTHGIAEGDAVEITR